MSTLHDKLNRGETAIGTHISLNSSFITELIGNLGFDYLWIDTEHTTISLEQLQQHLIAARAAGVSAIARVPWNDPVLLKPILEMGLDGIVIPMVNSYDEACKAMNSCQYPPKGNRGFGPQRAVAYGFRPIADYLANIDRELLKIVQVEHIDAVNDLDRILGIDVIDVLLIGPCDLASSMGRIGVWDDPEVAAVLDDICRKVLAAGKKLGVSCGPCTDTELNRWQYRGVDMISVSGDTAFLFEGAQAMQSRLKRTFGTGIR